MQLIRGTLLPAALAGTALLAACGNGDAAGAQSPTSSASSTSAPTAEVPTSSVVTEPAGSASPTETAPPATSLTPLPGMTESPADDAALISPRTDLKDEQPLAWQPAGTSGNAVYITVITARPSCQGVRVEKEETKDSVKIATFVGSVPGAPDACTREALVGKVKIELNEPLGSRALLHANGAPTATAAGKP